MALTLYSGVLKAATPMAGTVEQSAVSEAISITEPDSKAAVRDLVSQLNDDAVRALLIERLDAVAEAKELAAANEANAGSPIQQGFATYWENSRKSVGRANEIPSIVDRIFSSIHEASSPDGIAKLLWITLMAIAVGVVAERVVSLLFRKSKQRLIEAVSTTLWGILKIIHTRLAFDIAGVLAFGLAAKLVISNFYPAESLPNLFMYCFIAACTAGGMGFVLARFYFAPGRPDLRICNTSDERAWRLTISYAVLAAYFVWMHNVFWIFGSIGHTEDGNMDGFWPLAFFTHISMYALAVLTIWFNRHALTEVLLENKKRVTLAIGDEAPEDVSWFAVNWPKIAMALLVAKYFCVEIVVNAGGVGVYSQSAVYITFVVIFLWPGIDALISLFVWKSVEIPEDETEAAAKARRKMQQGLLRVGRVVVVGLVLYTLARLWGLNILDLAESGLGAQATGNLIELLFIFMMAYLMWELVTIMIERWLALEGGSAEDQEEGAGEIGGVGLSRVATVLPILHKTAKVLIVVVSIIMVLDTWGINIGPIIAGAGVVGLAIGFGAQTLVKDIVSGLFFLADDAFRVGEYIDVEGTMGNVEKISLRSLRLRHHRGLVHTIPYGEIPKLTNFSRDWVIMKLRFRVPFDTDINKVKKIFKGIGNDLLTHPELGEDFLQPFKSQGVAEVDDNGIVVRGKFMAKPGKQFMIRKEVYVRVQKAFEEAGIPFARKQVMVHIPGLEGSQQLSAEDTKNIAAAASEAAEEELPTADKKPSV
ncbi:MAG: mechanosensitive ion channel domain-containing protein [Granulosicoccaceae bacterium]